MALKTSKALLEKNTVSKRVLERLRQDILMNCYPIGSRLREIELASAYDSSRGTIRTALQALSSEGLVEFLDNGGCVVVGIDKKFVCDTYSLRKSLELQAAQIILDAPNISYLPLVKVLDRCAPDQFDPDSLRNPGEFYADLDMELHRAMVSIASNRPILCAWCSMYSVVRNLLVISLTDSYQQTYINRFYERHKAMTDFVILRDPRLLGEIEQQMENGLALSLRALDSIQNKSSGSL